MKDEDDSSTEWTFQVGGEALTKDTEKSAEAPPVIPFKAKPVVEKKSSAVGKVVLDLGDIDNAAKLEIDRRSSKLRIDTEQAVALQKEAIKKMRAVEDVIIQAPVIKRIVAQFVDFFVILLLFIVSAYFVPFGVKVTKNILASAALDNMFDKSTTPQLVHLVFFLLGIYIIFVVFLSATNTTVGKRAMDLQVRDVDSSTISLSQAFLREMILKPLSFLSILGVLYVFVNKERKTLHDLLSSTLVVSKK